MKKRRKKFMIPSIITNGLDSYKIMTFLGSGEYAECYKVTDIKTGHLYVAKILSKARIKSSAIMRRFFQNEIKLHRIMKHPNIVNFIDTFEINTTNNNTTKDRNNNNSDNNTNKDRNNTTKDHNNTTKDHNNTKDGDNNTTTKDHNNLIVILLEFCSGGSLLDLITRLKIRKRLTCLNIRKRLPSLNTQKRSPSLNTQKRSPSLNTRKRSPSLNTPKRLTTKKRFTSWEIRKYSGQILDGLEYIHSKKVIHRDIKLNNILIDENDNIKICDFGMAVSLYDGDNTKCGTPNYMAPEILTKRYPTKTYSDGWSLGVLIYTMAVGKTPFEMSDKERTYRQIKDVAYCFPEGIKVEYWLQDLIRKILVKVPTTRLTIDEIRKHKFFTNNTI